VTNREKEIYSYILSFIKENGYSPTIREICKGLYITVKTAHTHVMNLKNKGIINHTEKVARSIVVRGVAV
jgi:repressor LexA